MILRFRTTNLSKKEFCLNPDLSILSNSLEREKGIDLKPTFITVVTIISGKALAASLVSGENTSAAVGAVLHTAGSCKIKAAFISVQLVNIILNVNIVDLPSTRWYPKPRNRTSSTLFCNLEQRTFTFVALFSVAKLAQGIAG